MQCCAAIQILFNFHKVMDELQETTEEDLPEEEEGVQADCRCLRYVRGVTPQDVWKGHLCTVEMRRLKCPLLRAAMRKGHTFKLDLGADSARTEIQRGLVKYLNHWASRNKASEGTIKQLETWKEKVLDEVQRRLTKEQHSLYPKGNSLRKESERLCKDLVFLKEDRAPHVMVVMCKRRYISELNKELNNQETFVDATEAEEVILARHRQFQIDRGLDTNERLCYLYGIWKSAKKKMRWISGVKKSQDDHQKGLREKPQGSIAGVGT